MTIRTGDPSRASRAVPDDQPDRNPSLSAIHKTVARLALALVLASAVPAGAAAAVDPTRSVVKVYVATIGRDVASPWRPGSNFNVTGSGAVIAGRRILTAAHVVDDQTPALELGEPFSDATGSRIVIDRARAAAAAGEILARYAISADRSPRLVAAVERSAERPQQARDGKPVLGASR
jgi:hypothetical protein